MYIYNKSAKQKNYNSDSDDTPTDHIGQDHDC